MNTLTQQLSLGEMLAQAREEKGVSLEQAVHDTKIRATQLREMESDNNFHFSHSSYARFFLRDYARYLGISRQQIEEFLPEAGEFSSDGMEYLNGYAKEEVSHSLYRISAPSPRRSPALAVYAVAVLALLLISLGAYGWHAHTSSKQDDKAVLVGDENAKPVSAPASHVNVTPVQTAPVEAQQSGKSEDTTGTPLASIRPTFSETANPR